MGTRVAVTGAAGFVGAAVARRLVADGHDVVCVVRPGSDAPRLAGLDVERLEADLEAPDAPALVGAARPDACVHAAAAGAVTPDHDLARVVRVNALLPPLLAEALAAAGCRRFVGLGSSSEYGPRDGPMRETDAAAPDDGYGAAKLAGGILARRVASLLGLEAAWLRLFSVYGPGEDPRRLIPALVGAALAGTPLDLSPGDQVRDFVFVDDVAEAVAVTLARPRLDAEVVNVATGVQTSVRDAAAVVARLTGADPALFRFGALPYRNRSAERFSWRADTAHAERVLDWRAQHDLEAGLRRTVEATRL